jgi:hypothetical protein
MTTSTSNKRPNSDNPDPLRNAGILHHVLSFVVPGLWLFLGLLSAEWRGAYLRDHLVACEFLTGFVVNRRSWCVGQRGVRIAVLPKASSWKWLLP